MKINWLEDIDPFEISYVDKPAIDKRFIAFKRVDDKSLSNESNDSDNKSFTERIAERFGFGHNNQKVGRVLNKTNENALLDIANQLVTAGEKIQRVLASVNKRKGEDEEMNKEEVKALVESTVENSLNPLNEKLDKILGEKDENIDKENVEENEEAKSDEEGEENEESKSEEDEESKEKGSKKEEDNGLTAESITEIVSNVVGEKVDGLNSRIEKLESKISAKPKSDKKKSADSETKVEKKREDSDFTGVFGLKV